jgi:hypothetical protein
MDGHARWQPAGRLDDVLGVQRISMRPAPADVKPVAVHVSLEGGVKDLDVLPVDTTLRTTTGQSGAAANDTLLLINHRFGAGRSVSLNFWMAEYQRLRKAGTARPRLDVLQNYLSLAGVTPLADVRRASGEPLRCSEIVVYRKNETKFLAILPEPDCAEPGPVSLTLPSLQFVYDLRTHRLLGQVSKVNSKLVRSQPLLLALLPSPIGGLEFTGGSRGTSKVKPGDTVNFSISIPRKSGEIGPASAAQIEVRGPDGKVVDYYGKTVALPNSRGEFSTGLALNDAPGIWRVTARKPYAHKVASTGFVVMGQ